MMILRKVFSPIFLTLNRTHYQSRLSETLRDFKRNCHVNKDENFSKRQQLYDYFLVLDFEATCERNDKNYTQEIIEFPVLKVNGKSFKTEATFHHYVRPVINPLLSNFCIQLTGIIPDMVEDELDFPETLKSFVGSTGIWPKGLKGMISDLDLQFIGQAHSGIDDCQNIAAVMKVLATKRLIFRETGRQKKSILM
ncbi:ERI1 exoribonuclease 3 [Nymphon striatum]|nr:ERI1 exoribonuclease 3 [Nymphon striatum]